MDVAAGRLFALDVADQPEVLARALDANAAALERARDLIGCARAVRLLALGSSRHAAGYGAAAIEHLAGVPAGILPAPGWGVDLVPIDPGDVIVSVSQSGSTPALVKAVTAAKGRGAAVVAVVNAVGSPLERLADVTLRCGAGPERVIAATKSVTSAMLLLRAAAAPVHGLDRLVAAVDLGLATDLSAALDAPPPAWVVCSGVTGEWVADEIALKFAEVGGRVVAAETLIEFLHGPIAAPGPVLALIDGDDPNAVELTTRADTVVLATPSIADPWLDPLVTVVVGQRIAAAWAVALGCDPDAPKGLDKVTRTR